MSESPVMCTVVEFTRSTPEGYDAQIGVFEYGSAESLPPLFFSEQEARDLADKNCRKRFVVVEMRVFDAISSRTTGEPAGE